MTLTDILIFSGFVVVFAFLFFTGVLSARGYTWPEFLDDPRSKPALKSAVKGLSAVIILAVAITVLALFIPKAEAIPHKVKFFTKAGVFLGVDYVNNSPQCEQRSLDEDWTSNLGAWIRAVEWGNLSIDGRFTHHSCGVGTDRNEYNGPGIHLNYEIPLR